MITSAHERCGMQSTPTRSKEPMFSPFMNRGLVTPPIRLRFVAQGTVRSLSHLPN